LVANTASLALVGRTLPFTTEKFGETQTFIGAQTRNEHSEGICGRLEIIPNATGSATVGVCRLNLFIYIGYDR
jgi:hypothetical protein